MDTKRTVKEIERIIAFHEENPIRSKIIVPNVSWGFFDSHEADLVVINKSLYLTEYEIKRSFEDFKADFRKKDYHKDSRISKLYYAVPESICDRCKEYLESQYTFKAEEHAGIYAYSDKNWNLKLVLECNYSKGKRMYVEDALEIARLGTLRLWKQTETGADNNEKQLVSIDAASEWISEHSYDYLTCDGPMEPYYIRKNDFASDFRDAMRCESGNGYKMVDLGLPSGLKWADRNVGAASPEAFGDYFMWGSVTPDTNSMCDWKHAPFNNGSEKFNAAHFNEHKSEWLTEGGILKLEYDAAHAIMGGNWRMPTYEDMRELIDGTAQSAEELNSIAGMRFTAPNGNSIFMPFCGYRDDFGVYTVSNCGYAWSSSLFTGDAYYSHSLYFSGGVNADAHGNDRHDGFAVRGVHE